MQRLLILTTLICLGEILAGSACAGAQECPRLQLEDFPLQDRPAVIDSNLIRDQESSQYYYGIGRPVDYAKARQLAFIEMAVKGKNEGPFEGSSILLMIYANGYGVPRNLDLAIRLACGNVDGASAEVVGRAAHLKALQTGATKGTFDLCDDITSGYMEGFCAGIKSDLDSVARAAVIDSVVRRWPEKDRLAFARLRETAMIFIDERVFSEVDAFPTSRVALALQEEEDLNEAFKVTIFAADHCQLAPASATEFLAADRQLNTLYMRIMNAKKPLEWGTVTKVGIGVTERKWIAYRDAWVAFGAVHCPQITADAWKARITNERIEQLKNFAEMTQ